MANLPTAAEFQPKISAQQVADKVYVKNTAVTEQESDESILGKILNISDFAMLRELLSATFKDGSKIFDLDEKYSWIDYISTFHRFSDAKSFINAMSNFVNYDDFIFLSDENLEATMMLENMIFFESGAASKLVGDKCIHCGKNTVYSSSVPYSRDEQPNTKYHCIACDKAN